MQRTAMTVVGLVLAGWGAGFLHAQEPAERDAAIFDKILEVRDDLERSADAARQAQPTGRAVIRGTVTSAATGAPVRGATVRGILASGGAAPASAITDDNGAFELRGLAAGNWRVSASKSGFVPRDFGQRGPSGRGTVITLKDRDQAAASIALVRGGAAMGRVFDEFGEPAVGTRVQAMQFMPTENGRRLVPAGVPDITDDTGAFRVYGLMPGDYLVSARAQTPFDADTFIVAERLVVNVNEKAFETTAPIGRPVASPRATASTYFPGTADISVADRVTIGAGEERGGIDFALTRASNVRISGIVIDSSGARPSGSVMISLISDSPEMRTTFAMSSTSINGGFDFRDVPPGSYNLEVSVPGPRMELAEMPLRVTEDLTGLEIATAPGVALSGTVTGDGGTLPAFRGMVVRARPLSGQQRAFTATSGAVIEGAFQVPNLLGAYGVSVEGLPAGWVLKGIEVDGADVTDSTVTFKPGQRPHATVILTNRVTSLTGVVTNDGKPVDAEIAIFPDDPAKWTSSRFVRSLRADDKGMFSLRGLPPHDRYLAVATEYLEEGELRNPEFLELLRSRGTSFSLEEGQSRPITLTFVERSTIDGR